MKRKKIILILAAIIFGILTGIIVLKEVGARESEKNNLELDFREEIQKQTSLLDSWETTSGIVLSDEQLIIIQAALEEIRTAQDKIKTDATLTEILQQQEAVKKQLIKINNDTDSRFFDWKSSLMSFENTIIPLLNRNELSNTKYKERLYSVNTLRQKYLELLVKDVNELE